MVLRRCCRVPSAQEVRRHSISRGVSHGTWGFSQGTGHWLEIPHGGLSAPLRAQILLANGGVESTPAASSLEVMGPRRGQEQGSSYP